MPVLRSLFALLAVASFAAADEVQSLGGKSVTGTIVSINEAQIKVKTPGGDVIELPLVQVLAVKFREIGGINPAAKFTDVTLVDDTLLHCKKLDVQGNDVELTLLSGAVLKVPLTKVVSFLREANNQPQARKFEEIAAKRLAKDRIVILSEGELNVLEGTLGDVKGKTISFKTEANVVDLPIERLHGVIFFRQAGGAAGTPICRVYDVEGNNLTAMKVVHDGDKLTLTTTLGNQLTLKSEQLAKLDFNLGKLTYLSDMVPARVVEKSAIGLSGLFQKDKNLDGDPIQLDRVYAKGLSLHAHTELEYNLNGKYQEFKCTLGIDVRTGENSQPKVTIYGDDNVLFSGEIKPGPTNVRQLSERVKGVRVLRIVVSSRNPLDLGDHVTLADARVSQQ